jgi:hypothetical protein
MKNLLLKNNQSPGDVLVLTAAVRDLHRLHPGAFRTAVDTSAGAMWEHNPHIVPKTDAPAETIECRYPLIHKSNSGAWHFIHAFHHFLSERLGIPLEPQEFRGDIHLGEAEKRWISQVQEITRLPVPYWIIVAGGKYDFTAKWFDPGRLQQVVDHFRGKILFVQVGERGHHHPPLRGVLDLRGKTNLRQYVRLMHHAQGAVCPVTFTMHLAAATPVRGRSGAYPTGMPRNRPCVVLAGGREPVQWEAYPLHQYIHTNGALPCCAHGGCWKSRVVPIGDGDDKERSLCVDVAELATGIRKPGAEWGAAGVTEQGCRLPKADEEAEGAVQPEWTMRYAPQCLNMIPAEEIVRRIELYFTGGVISYLTNPQAAACHEAVPALDWEMRGRQRLLANM